MRFFMILSFSLGMLLGCTTIKEGPPVELADVAVPKVVDEAAHAAANAAEGTTLSQTSTRPQAPSPSTVPPSRPGFRAWIPRVVTRNGDVHAGHYVEVSDKAPQKELTRPDYEIPKAPRQIYRPAAKKETPSGLGSPSGPVLRPSPGPFQGSLPPNLPLPQEGAYESVQP